ncbi:UNVERIFIED_CONTAM: hypothetical protein K2H54_054932 [Gekko kuhli]
MGPSCKGVFFHFLKMAFPNMRSAANVCAQQPGMQSTRSLQGIEEVESVEHVLLLFLIRKFTQNIISPLLRSFSGCSEVHILKKLLVGVNQQTTIVQKKIFSLQNSSGNSMYGV